MKRFVTTAASLALAAGFAVSAHAFSVPPAPQAGSNSIIKVGDGDYTCQWFAIFTCAKSYNGAQKGVNKYGGYVIDTDNYDRFRGGYYCSVKGPYASKKTANKRVRQARRKGASSPYAKKGCGVGL